MTKKELVIIKLGGSAITKKDEGRYEIKKRTLSRLCGEISESLKEKDIALAIIHGAGPFGHIPARRYELNEGLKGPEQLEGFSITHHSMQRLNCIVVGELIKKGVNAIEFQPSSCGMLVNEKIASFPTTSISKLMGMGMVPVLYGDVLMDKNRGLGILSGDHIASYLAAKLAADRVIMAADVGGIYERDPKKHKDARLFREICAADLDRIGELSRKEGTDVTGGMERKLRELLALAEIGCESEIIGAGSPGLLKRAICGEKYLGTRIVSRKKGRGKPKQ